MSTEPGSILFGPSQQIWQRRFLIATLVVGAGMLVVDQPLKTAHAPLGIISLQIAGSPQAAKQIVYDWHPKERLSAAFGLGLDYLFLASYCGLLFLGNRWSAERWSKTNETRGKQLAWLSWGAIIAGVLDSVENVILLIFLQSDGRSVLYPLAFACAAAKFALILLAIIVWIYGTRTPRDPAAPKTPAKK